MGWAPPEAEAETWTPPEAAEWIPSEAVAVSEQPVAPDNQEYGRAAAMKVAMDFANKPLISLPRAAQQPAVDPEAPVLEQGRALGRQINAGAANAGANLVEGLATPANIVMAPLAISKGLGRVVAGLFGAKMLSDIPEQIKAAEEQPTVQGRLEGGLGVLTSMFLGTTAAGYAGGRTFGKPKPNASLKEQLGPIIGEKPTAVAPEAITPEPVAEVPFVEAPVRVPTAEVLPDAQTIETGTARPVEAGAVESRGAGLGPENEPAQPAGIGSDVARPESAAVDAVLRTEEQIPQGASITPDSLEQIAPEIQQRVTEVAKVPEQAQFVKGMADQARDGFGPGAAASTEFVELAKTNAREYATIGASHLLEGKLDKATWTDAMRQEYGARDASPVELNKIWRDAHEFVADFSESQVSRPVRVKTQIEESAGIRPAREINDTVSGLRDTMSKMLTRAEGLTTYLKGQEKGAKLGASEATSRLKMADRWLEADRGAIRDKLLDFSMNLPLHERAKFTPAITNALRRAPITSRDPAVMYRRAEDVLNRMTGAVYEVARKDVSTKIEKVLAKTEASKSMTVPEKEAIRQRGVTFNNLRDKMSLDMLEHMHERVQELRQLGRDLFVLDQTIQAERVKATLREIQTQGARKIDLPENTRLALGQTESAWQKRLDLIRRAPELIKHFNLSLTPMDWMIQTFDKAPQGAIYRTMKVPVDVRYGEWLDSTAAYKRSLTDVAQKNKLTPGSMDRIYAHAELRQEGGQANLEALGYSKAEINSAKTLSRGELEYLREADRINNELFPVVKKVLNESFHQEIEKVQGYFPRQRDWDYYNTLSIEEGRFARAINRTNTEKGFTVSRVGATTKNVTNAHQVMMNHIDDSVYHIKMGPEIRRIADVVKTEEFAQSVGTWGQKVFSDWTDVLSRNGGIGSGRRIQAIDVLRKNVGMAQLAFRLTTTALQPLSLIQGMAIASPKNMVLALDGVLTKSRREFILNNFPEIRSRVGDDPAYSDYGGTSVRDKLGRGGFKAIAYLDRMSAMTVAEAAYRDSLDARGIAFDMSIVDKQGVQEAQAAVRRTQSSSYPKDVPLAISRGNFSGNASVDKAIFQFQNFIINRWALLKNGALQMGIEEKSPKAGARILAFVLLGTIAEQLSRDGIARVVQATLGATPQQDKKRTKEAEQAYARNIAEKAAIDLVTAIPIVTNIYGMARFEGSGMPVVDSLSDAISGATKIIEGKKAETKAVGAVRAVQAVGALGGVPTGQAGDIAVQAIRGGKKKSDSDRPDR